VSLRTLAFTLEKIKLANEKRVKKSEYFDRTVKLSYKFPVVFNSTNLESNKELIRKGNVKKIKQNNPF
jgi:hypothetical protein